MYVRPSETTATSASKALLKCCNGYLCINNISLDLDNLYFCRCWALLLTTPTHVLLDVYSLNVGTYVQTQESEN